MLWSRDMAGDTIDLTVLSTVVCLCTFCSIVHISLTRTLFCSSSIAVVELKALLLRPLYSPNVM